MSKTVLILGGGVGGNVAASLLRKSLPHAHRVVLVEREERYVFPPSLLWLMIGHRTPKHISRTLDALRKRRELIRQNSSASTVKPITCSRLLFSG